MYHSVTFGDKNTYDDWHIVPSSRPLFAPPAVKENYVDIPGSNGHLDLTDALNGYPVFENRKGSIEFMVLNGYGSWVEKYSTISNYLHGQKMKAYLEDDPGWYYEGRFAVNEWRSEKDWSRIVIDYDVYPYKKEIVDSVSDWEWDPFNFKEGIIRELADIQVNGVATIELTGSSEFVAPLITVKSTDGAGMDLIYAGITYHLYDGENKNPNILIKQEGGTMDITGNGSITIQYRGGSL